MSQLSQSSASDFFARGRKATTTQRIVTAKKPVVNAPPPPNSRLPAPESIPTIKPNAKYRLAETSFDDDGLDDEEFNDSDFEADGGDDDDDIQIVAVVKPVAPTITKAKDRTISNPRALSNTKTKTKEDIPIRRAHSAVKLLEVPSTVSRKRSKSEMNTRSVSAVLESSILKTFFFCDV